MAPHCHTIVDQSLYLFTRPIRPDVKLQPLKVRVEEIYQRSPLSSHSFNNPCRATLTSYHRKLLRIYPLEYEQPNSRAYNYYFYINLFYSAYLEPA